MPSLPSNKDTLLNPLVAFSTQAVTGIQMAVFRMTGTPPDSKDPNIGNLKVALFANYLNDCWKSLILQDDDFVVNSFQEIYNVLPSESPLCLIHKIMAVGQIFLQVSEIEFETSIPEDQRNHENPLYVNLLRGILETVYKEKLYECFDSLFSNNEFTLHQCSGPKFPQIIEEDPESPIFNVSLG